MHRGPGQEVAIADLKAEPPKLPEPRNLNPAVPLHRGPQGSAREWVAEPFSGRRGYAGLSGNILVPQVPGVFITSRAATTTLNSRYKYTA